MIAYVEQRGLNVYAYDSNRRLLFSCGGELVGYTSTSVTVKQSGVTRVFNEKGQMIK